MKKKYIKGPDEPSSGLLMRSQKLLVLLLFVFFGVSNVQGQVTVYGALTGNGTYTTLGAAFTAIGTTQTAANINIDISGDTNELTLAKLDAGDWSSLTIKPVGGNRTISGNLASEMIQFNGADNVTIDGLYSGGKGLTISNLSTSANINTSTISFVGDATNNTITNCNILGSNTTNTSTAGGVVFFGTGTLTGNDGNTISSCDIGPAGTALPAKLIFSLGTNTNEGTCNSEITISDCNLYDYFLASNNSAAIFASTGSSAWNITNNKIYQTGTRTFASGYVMYGICFSSANYGNGVRIIGNTIGYATNAATGTLNIDVKTFNGSFYGIFTNTSPTASETCYIADNAIANVALTSTSATNGTIYGIYNGATTGTSNTINIEGNTIRNLSNVNNTGMFYGISAGVAATLNCNDNTIDNLTRNAAGILYGINYGSAPNVTVDGNTITNLRSTSTTSTSAMAAIFSSTASQLETVKNNTITGLTSSSTGAQTIDGIKIGTGTANKTIQNNVVSNITLPATGTGTIHGIRMANAGPVNVISGNTVCSFSGGNSGGINGISMSAGTLNNVYNNKVWGLSGTGAASQVIGFGITGGGTYNIYNNIMGDLTAPVATNGGVEPHHVIGINSWGMPMNLYNNTIVLNGLNTGTNFGSSAVSSGGPLTLRNNILINNLPSRGTGVSVVLRLAGGISPYDASSNNNLLAGTNIHVKNQAAGPVTNDLDATLAAFKIRAAGRDVSSVTETPTFVSMVGSDANYLHINTTVPTQIESGGAPITTVTDDFDGNPRNPSTPDIGADEFTGIALDLTGPIVVHTPDPTCASGTRTISATFTDASGVPTGGVGLPVAYWRINSGAYTAAVGTSMGNGVYEFTIGTGSVMGDGVYYYFVAQDNASTPNVSVYPSLGAAGFGVNPPLAATPPTAPLTLATPMNGIYTVGVGGNYTTLTAAVSDYNKRCLNGPVTFTLTDVAYASETYPIIIQQNADASAVKTLTIKPASGVTATISGNVASELIQLNGADYVTIDGLNSGASSLTITNTNATATAGTIKFQNDATNNTITNSFVLGSTTVANTVAGGVIFFGTGTANGNDGNTISNCNIGPAGTNPSKLIGSIGSTTNAGIANSGITITNCNFYDFFMSSGCSAIYAGAGNTDWTITNNKMYQTATRTFTVAGILYGIAFSNSAGENVKITGNTIGYADSTGAGNMVLAGSGVAGEFQGIYFNSSPSATTVSNINNNTFANISLASSTGRFFGIYNGSGAASNTININGNVVKNIVTTTTTGVVNPIYAGQAATLNCNNNTIDNISRNGIGSFYGINYAQCTNATFDSNIITNLSSTATTGTTTFAGFYANSASATETFTNNTISNLSSLSTQLIPIYGIWNNISVATGDRIFRNNTISDFSLPATGTGTMYGIRMPNSGALNEISGNTIHTFTGGSSITGISIGGGATNNVFRNKIYGLSTASTASVSLWGMYLSGGTTNNVYNNIIGNITATATTLAGTPSQVNGITAAAGTVALNLYNNTVVLSGTSSGANFGSTIIGCGPAVALLMRNNVFVNNCVATGTGVATMMRRAGVVGYDAASNNNLFYGQAYYTDNAGATDYLLDTFKNRLVNRDGLSVSENPNFLSMVGSDANYLHINPAIPTQIESAGVNITSGATDFDGDTRNATTPDLGADEFAGTPLTVVTINNVGITPSGDQCTAVSRTVTANVTAGGTAITSVVLKYWFNGVAQTPITMTGGTLTTGTTSDFTATIPMVSNVSVTWEVYATDAVTTKLKVGTAYKDAPLFGLVGAASASLNNLCPGGSSVLSASIVPQTTQYSNSFETGVTEFTGGAVAGTANLTQSTAYVSNGTASMYLKPVGVNSNVYASLASNVDLSTLPQAYLTFSHIAGMEGPSTATDLGYVEYSTDGGTNWIAFPTSSYQGAGTLFNSAVCFSARSYTNWTSAFVAPGSTPNNSLWQSETIAIPTAALTSQFRIRFRYIVNASNNYYGWLIDNVKIVSGAPSAITNYSWSDGTTVVGTTNNLSVSPTATTTYTATLTSGGCTVTTAPITVTVNTTAQPSASAHIFCGNATVANLNATGNGVQWYAVPAGGSPMSPGDALTTGTYYVTQTISGCESPRMAVPVTIGTAQPTASAQTFCTAATVTNLAATGTGIQWYANPVGGLALSSTDALSTGTYYVTQTISGCESPRLAVSVTVGTAAQPTASAQTFCTAATVANLTATGTGIQWYTGSTGGSVLLSTDALSTGTYYVTQTISGCESPRLPVSVTVNTTAQPTVSAQTFCNSATVANLTATGTGVQWYAGLTGGSALLSTDALSNGTYYVTQTVSGCESPRLAVTVTVNTVAAPTGSSTQTISGGVPSDATIEDLTPTGPGIVWYPTAADALAGTNAIPAGTQLTNGSVYYAMQTVGGCRSTSSLAVTVSVTLGVNDFVLSNLKLYPNPVAGILKVENGQAISTIEVYSITGQRVMTKIVNAMSASIDMSPLAGGTYLVKVVADDAVKTVKVIKK
ncbi:MULTISPECIES: T9SS type A sorting domain-containing protein [Flavobacterium]|uniref:Ig-like domain-containing protein n=1 Tax=Flavobacterium TaxID=237 RepID=UPI001FCB6044|nr:MULTISPECIES: T9SS type A sorting domain-containing protein [Flavobacterium]UOK43676.1 T9SS type A sorting domain-containing protein [Flavobacterium enshiense]